MIKTLILICFFISGLSVCSQNMSDFYNPEVNLRKDTLRILDIGNHFSNDAMSMLVPMVERSGVNIEGLCIYKAVGSGASFKSWIDIWNDKESSKPYSINKVIGGIDQQIKGNSRKGNGEKFRNAIMHCQWDLIIIHQLSPYSFNFNQWESKSKKGYLKELISIIRSYQPHATIGTMINHAPNDVCNGNTQNRFKEILTAYQSFTSKYNVSFIIPYGTAVENLRSSCINSSKHNLSRDNHHLGYGIAQYAASCVYFQSIFAPRYNVSFLDSEITCDVADISRVRERFKGDCISVNKSNIDFVKKAVESAIENMYEISNIDEMVIGNITIDDCK